MECDYNSEFLRERLELLLDKLGAARLFLLFPLRSYIYCKELRHWLKGELLRKV